MNKWPPPLVAWPLSSTDHLVMIVFSVLYSSFMIWCFAKQADKLLVLCSYKPRRVTGRGQDAMLASQQQTLLSRWWETMWGERERSCPWEVGSHLVANLHIPWSVPHSTVSDLRNPQMSIQCHRTALVTLCKRISIACDRAVFHTVGKHTWSSPPPPKKEIFTYFSLLLLYDGKFTRGKPSLIIL